MPLVYKNGKKRCFACKQFYSISFFSKDKSKRDGLKPYCFDCSRRLQREKLSKDPERMRAYWRKYYSNHRVEFKKNVDKYQRRLKDDVFFTYGGYICVCCGETELFFLTIDHIEENGGIHRKEIHQKGRNFYRWLRKNNYPDGFQVLCFNCNVGKYLNKGICPHATSR